MLFDGPFESWVKYKNCQNIIFISYLVNKFFLGTHYFPQNTRNFTVGLEITDLITSCLCLFVLSYFVAMSLVKRKVVFVLVRWYLMLTPSLSLDKLNQNILPLPPPPLLLRRGGHWELGKTLWNWKEKALYVRIKKNVWLINWLNQNNVGQGQ